MQRALVAGATGYLGRHVVAEMKRPGIWVRALARPGKEVPGADEVLFAEATRSEALAGACEGVDVAFSSLGITRQTDRVTYEDVDYGENRNLLEEAERADVSRFGFVSTIIPNATIKGWTTSCSPSYPSTPTPMGRSNAGSGSVGS